ncbi:MAG: hypothetical protein ACXV3V_09440, partial [Actinomycetes bacterium]
MLRVAAAVGAAVVGIGCLGTSPALAAPKKQKVPLTITSPAPANPTQLRTATFEWSGVTGTSYTCTLDGVASTCSSPVTYSGLVDAVHTFSLKATQSPTYRPNTYTYSWRVAGTPPAAPTITPVASPTRTDSAVISFVDSDPKAASFKCALDSAALAACTSPFTVSGLADGAHSVTVRAYDAFGLASAPATVGWVVDSTAPSNVVLTGPSSPTNDASPQVTFSATGATAYTCTLDGGAPVACTSPYAVPGPLDESLHSLTVTASDAAGNVSNPATANWIVDVTAPVTPVISTGP